MLKLHNLRLKQFIALVACSSIVANFCQVSMQIELGRVGSPVDMWSFGCILAELVGDVTIFPGTSTMHMVNLIAEARALPRWKI